jgi:hypothetical protein
MATSDGHVEANDALSHEDSQPEQYAPGGVPGMRRRLEGGGASCWGWDPAAASWGAKGAGEQVCAVPKTGMAIGLPERGSGTH